MAGRRAFAKKFTESESFLKMNTNAQVLYFHLAMNADDDGFVMNPMIIQCMCGVPKTAYKKLIENGLLIEFKSGVVAITHWNLHNTIRSDRYKRTSCIDELQKLSVTKSGEYIRADADGIPDGSHFGIPDGSHFGIPDGSHFGIPDGSHFGIPDGSHFGIPDKENKIDKDSINKKQINKLNNIYKKTRVNKIGGVGEREEGKNFRPPDVESVKKYCEERNNSVDAQAFVDFYSAKGWMIGKNKMKDWKAAVRTWERNRDRGNGHTERNDGQSEDDPYWNLIKGYTDKRS